MVKGIRLFTTNETNLTAESITVIFSRDDGNTKYSLVVGGKIDC